jgi:hypothetical protein
MTDHHRTEIFEDALLGVLVLLVALVAGLLLASFAGGIVVGGFALVGAGLLIDARDRAARHAPH